MVSAMILRYVFKKKALRSVKRGSLKIRIPVSADVPWKSPARSGRGREFPPRPEYLCQRQRTLFMKVPGRSSQCLLLPVPCGLGEDHDPPLGIISEGGAEFTVPDPRKRYSSRGKALKGHP